jgi:hypothetical protein
MIPRADGGFAVAGAADYDAWCGTTYGIVLMLLDTTSVGVTSREYAQSTYSGGQTVCQSRTGGFLIGGSVFMPHNADHGSDAFVMRTNAQGDSLWRSTSGQ